MAIMSFIIVISAFAISPPLGFLVLAIVVVRRIVSLDTNSNSSSGNYFDNNRAKYIGSSSESSTHNQTPGSEVSSIDDIHNIYELAARGSKILEEQLKRIGASGKGLHELTDSVEVVLNQPLVNKLRYIASIRNKVIHEHDFQLSDTEINTFKTNVKDAYALLVIK